jgi:hypothetical protein
MGRLTLFAEDSGHEFFLRALLERYHAEHGGEVELLARSVRGGAGRALAELQEYVRDVRLGAEPMPDLLVVGRDANCKGHARRVQEIERIVQPFAERVVCAVPEPHVERWLLLDPKAFRTVLGKGCDLPDQKCEKDRYKKLLREAVRDAGLVPLVGGLEHAADIVQAMDLVQARRRDASLRRFLDDLDDRFSLCITPPPAADA